MEHWPHPIACPDLLSSHRYRRVHLEFIMAAMAAALLSVMKAQRRDIAICARSLSQHLQRWGWCQAFKSPVFDILSVYVSFGGGCISPLMLRLHIPTVQRSHKNTFPRPVPTYNTNRVTEIPNGVICVCPAFCLSRDVVAISRAPSESCLSHHTHRSQRRIFPTRHCFTSPPNPAHSRPPCDAGTCEVTAQMKNVCPRVKTQNPPSQICHCHISSSPKSNKVAIPPELNPPDTETDLSPLRVVNR